MSFLFGRAPKIKQMPTLNPEQQSLLSDLLSQLQGGASEGFGESIDFLRSILSGEGPSYDALEAPIMRQFSEKILPQLTERLTASGAGGGRSSGAAQVLGSAGAGLAENLAAQRANLQQNAISQLLSSYLQGSNLGLGSRSFGYGTRPGTAGLIPSLFGASAPGLGYGASNLLGLLGGLS